ncbi:MAG: multicopper oxidase domain-containing protein, partial [Chitinophagaceae bacterium]
MKVKFPVHTSTLLKIVSLVICMSFLSAGIAQQTMQNMPGMNMPKPKPKPVVKKKPPAAKPPAKPQKNMSKDSSMQGMQMNVGDTIPVKDSMPGMNMPDPPGGDKMQMKSNDTSKQEMMDMNGMQKSSMEDFVKAKANLGVIKRLVNNTPPRTVRYDLYVKDTTVLFGKKPKRAIAVNGQIPMPTLIFTEGDTAEIYVHNEMDEPTSLHWHGLFLPNKEDGVAYLTQMPIPPHSTYVYRFPIKQNGTHWYHSHFELQEQIGMYGMFIMNKRNEWDIPTIPLVISEWADMKPEEINRSLHNATDWFAIQKGTTQSYAEAIKNRSLKTKLTNEWKRMNAMDVSDVHYDNFLLNGKNQLIAPTFKSGDKVRLRVANGGASDYFWLSYAGGKMTV